MRQLSYLLLLLSIPPFFISCNNTSNENIAAFQSFEETLSVQNQMMAAVTSSQHIQLQEKLNDPYTHEKALYYFPKAEKIKIWSLSVIDYIDSLKRQLKKSALVSLTDSLSEEALMNTKSVKGLFVSGRKGEELYKKLQQYRTDVLGVDPFLAKEFEKSLQITSVSFEKNKNKDFTKFFFYDLSLVAALTMLTKFQANVYAIQQKTTIFLNTHAALICCIDFRYAPIVVLNSSCVLPGEYIEVTTGVGGMLRSLNQQVFINGKEVSIDETSTATAKIRASSQPGNYSMPVEIRYVDPNDGLAKIVSKTLKYSVFRKN